jgi:predicted membrane protein
MMNEKKIINALNVMKALSKDEMKVFMFSANSYFNGDDDTEEKDEDDIDKLKSDLEMAYGDIETTYGMIRKVYFGEAKIVYDVYGEDSINFEDNAGEFLW